MMDRISLDNVLPDVFSEQTDVESDVWKNNLTFEKGKSYLIKADSGTGKSSLCSYIYGYRNDYSGDITFDSRNARQLTSHQWDELRCKHISLLFQELRLFPELTAVENIRLKNNLMHFNSDSRIDELFERLGIANRRDQLVSKMSWGQQQRVAIIRSLCQPFDFLFLDEPISHLDDTNSHIIANLIADELRSRGAGLIVTSIGKDLPIDYHQTLSL